jgi:hypothetical protein
MPWTTAFKTFVSGEVLDEDTLNEEIFERARAIGGATFMPNPTVWIPAAYLVPSGATLGLVGSAAAARQVPALAFDAAAIEYAIGVALPSFDLANGTLRGELDVAPSSTNTGVARWSLIITGINAGQQVDQVNDETRTVDLAFSAGVADQKYRVAMGTFTAITGGPLLRVTVQREATHVNDTFTGDAWLLGVRLIYTPNQRWNGTRRWPGAELISEARINDNIYENQLALDQALLMPLSRHWIPGAAFTLGGGAQTFALRGGAGGNRRVPSWDLSDAVTEYIATSLVCPFDPANTTVTATLYYTPATAGAGDVRLRGQFADVDDAQQIDQVAEDILTAVSTVPGSTDQLVAAALGTVTRTGQFWRVVLDRVGGHATDTYAADVHVIGVLLEIAPAGWTTPVVVPNPMTVAWHKAHIRDNFKALGWTVLPSGVAYRWVNPAEWILNTGTPARAVVGSAGGDTRIPAWALDQTTLESISALVYLPFHVGLGVVTASLYVASSVAINNAAMVLRASGINETDQIDEAHDVTLSLTQAVPATLDNRGTFAMGTINQFGNLLRLNAERDAANAGDTLAADLWLLGALLTWTPS